MGAWNVFFRHQYRPVIRVAAGCIVAQGQSQRALMFLPLFCAHYPHTAASGAALMRRKPTSIDRELDLIETKEGLKL